MSEERQKRLNSIGFTWKVRDWDIRFQQLMEYKQVHGNCIVPKRYQPNPQLGMWVSRQRTKEETMSEEKRKRLNSIGFTWKVREVHIPVDWEIRVQQLVEYKRVYGNCIVPIVPTRYQPNPQLGKWVSTQRENKETMSEERRNMLNSIGFTWKVREAHIIVDWEIRFQHLVDYKRVYGSCNVPREYKENPPLGIWVMNQRHKKETMSENRRNQLDSIGFAWSLKHEPKRASKLTVEDPKKKKARLDEEAAQEYKVYGQHGWDSYFEQLRDFVRKYNHCNVPAQHPELGRWAKEQRQLYEWKQIGKETRFGLTDEHEAKLMAVGFVFETGLSDDENKDWCIAFPSPIPNDTFSKSS